MKLCIVQSSHYHMTIHSAESLHNTKTKAENGPRCKTKRCNLGTKQQNEKEDDTRSSTPYLVGYNALVCCPQGFLHDTTDEITACGVDQGSNLNHSLENWM